MPGMSRPALVAALFLLLAPPSTIAEPASRQLAVDLTSSDARRPDSLRVDKGTRILLRIRKNMFHACTVTSKVDPVPASPDPVAQILGILGTIPGMLTADRRPVPPVSAPSPRPSDVLARQMAELLTDLVDLNADLEDQIAQIRRRTTSLPEWIACDGSAVCSDRDAARSKLDALASAIQRTLSPPIASTIVASARAAELLKAITARMNHDANEDDDTLSEAFARMRSIQELIDAAGERRQIAIRAREALQIVRDRIVAFTPQAYVDEPLAAQDNIRSTVTVTCANIVTQQPIVYTKRENRPVEEDRIPPVTATIIYQNTPRATVSAGVLYSTLGGREIGVAPHSTGTDASGVTTYQRRIAETDRSTWQLLPFSFLNVTVPGVGRRRFHLAGSLGIGLNPNNGSTVVEYFAGGTLGIGRSVGIQVGAHLGTRLEPAEQFAVGDAVPDRLTVIPTTHVRTTALGIALSYGLPFPR
jgi:hypothetical protein